MSGNFPRPRRVRALLWIPLFLSGWPGPTPRAEGEPLIWITPRGQDAGSLTVHWQSDAASGTTLRAGAAGGDLIGREVTSDNGIFRAELPVGKAGAGWRYQIGEGKVRELRGWGGDALKVVFVGDWHGNARPGSEAILKDDPHLLVTAGDNVTSLHAKGKEGLNAYAALVASAPGLFARIPVMPAVGNHDNEIRPRGPEPPAEPVYDITAKTFRTFFGLPEDGWRRMFRLPDDGVTLVMLDLHHTSDFGTTWQSGQPFDAGSEQVRWLRETVSADPLPFRLFVYNEHNARVRTLAGGVFGEAFRRRPGAVITGYGGFTERAEWEGYPAYNTHIHGGGTDYKDRHRAFGTAGGTYLLLTKARGGGGRVRIEIKNHAGEVLDTRSLSAGAAAGRETRQ